eukprot:TRINITY_DN0_c974_g1_i1.p1 TRINITY_DN0_c974_g1~~TRINITY_DN0_c974_g1_i1.p1  ORF type:complete len:119 (+),score=19.38 TRINITY_DN0_c974_g1_i1:349-705(+)
MGTLYLKKLNRCKIYAGPVSGSVFVNEVLNSEVNIAAQQLRIHNSEDTTFRTYVVSDTIIEHSTRLRFGPYSHLYDLLNSDLEASGFKEKPNNWAVIKDFNWLRQEASPNFEIVASST